MRLGGWEPVPGVQWSVLVTRRPAASPNHASGGVEVVLEHDADAVLRTASVGKLLLLGVVARALDAGELDEFEQLERSSVDPVADSGLWHVLDQPSFTVSDACRLVGAVSDNLATNVLLRRVGLDSVMAYADQLELGPMELLDQVRNERGPGMPTTLSRASARSLVRFLRLLEEGVVGARVASWMELNTDLSMVASAFGADPLAHQGGSLINKTGTDDGIRADVGRWVDEDGSRTSYAVVANWGGDPALVPPVLARMREIGDRIRS